VSLEAVCCVLVASCDAYSDLWPPFFRCFRRYGEDCPFSLYISSNSTYCSVAGVHTLRAGFNADWSSELRVALGRVQHRYVLLMLEDFFLRRPVRWGAILKALEFLDAHEGHMLRLVPRPKPTLPIVGSTDFGLIELGAPYRVSLQAAIWRRVTLQRLLRPGESVWEFELQGTVRSCAIPGGFVGSWKTLLDYGHHAVERGRWYPVALRRLRASEPDLELGSREVMSWSSQTRHVIIRLRNHALSLLPWRWGLSVRRFWRQLWRGGC